MTGNRSLTGTTHRTPPRRAAAGALAGLLAGAAAVGASEALAALLTGVTSPLLAVANRAVDTTPLPLKEFAIRHFGSHDKQVLIGGVIVTVALLAMAAGALGVRRPRLAVGGFVVLSAVATAAALTDRSATAGAAVLLLPALALLIVGLVALTLMLRALRSPAGGPTTDPVVPGPTTPDTTAQPRKETIENGKPRMLLGDLVPATVPGDELPAAFDRRTFLRAAVAVGAGAAAGGLVSRQLGGAAAAASRADVAIPRPTVPGPKLPAGASLDVPGITPHLTSNQSFYRVDTALKVPDVPVDGWSLRIHGDVDRELDLGFEDLLSRRLVERRITLTCVSNPVGGKYAGNATWIGVPVADLLEEAGVRRGADAVKSTSADDWTAGTPLSALLDRKRGALVAVAMNGVPLPLEHGFPARLVVPGLYGYVSATKWLVDLEVTRFADFKAYWTTRGYSAQAPIKTSSRIDVPRSFEQLKAGKQPVAGVAWSQDRGIRSVEVRVDGGPWQQTRLAEQDNVDTWRQWVWEWDAKPGTHTLEVRATDRTGYTQTSQRAEIAPDGATGWHSVNVSVS
ncbi:MAG: molybdopterin-dependent oxidoreductase [Nocardioides sp.]